VLVQPREEWNRQQLRAGRHRDVCDAHRQTRDRVMRLVADDFGVPLRPQHLEHDQRDERWNRVQN
jgi:hypothetical protein